MAARISASGDLFNRRGRKPWASVNFVTAHDGFTLHDLVSYNDKHNEANGEDNRDGHDDNHSWNHGAEGPTDDPAIRTLRERQKRNMLATLLLCAGHADAAGRRRVRPHPAGQQQRLLPGQRDLLGGLEHRRGRPRAGRLRAPAHPVAPPLPHPPPRPLPHRRPKSGIQGQGRKLGAPAATAR